MPRRLATRPIFALALVALCLSGCFRFSPLTTPGPQPRPADAIASPDLRLEERAMEMLGGYDSVEIIGATRISRTVYLLVGVSEQGMGGFRLAVVDFESGSPQLSSLVRPVRESSHLPDFVLLATQPPTLACIGSESGRTPATNEFPVVRLPEPGPGSSVEAAGRFVVWQDYYTIAPRMAGVTTSLAEYDDGRFRVLKRPDYNTAICPVHLSADGNHAAVLIRPDDLQLLRYDPDSGVIMTALDDTCGTFSGSVRGDRVLCAWSRGIDGQELALYDGSTTEVFKLGKHVCRVACQLVENGAVVLASCHAASETNDKGETVVFARIGTGTWTRGPWSPRWCRELHPIEVAGKAWIMQTVDNKLTFLEVVVPGR